MSVSRKWLIFTPVPLAVAVIGFLAGVGWMLSLGMIGVMAGVLISAVTLYGDGRGS